MKRLLLSLQSDGALERAVAAVDQGAISSATPQKPEEPGAPSRVLAPSGLWGTQARICGSWGKTFTASFIVP